MRENEDGLEIGLYYSPALRTRLEARSLRDTGWLAPGLDAYCRLAEGVSHFLYLARSAALGRRLTLLELEVQAEVDKFASLVLHRWPWLEPASSQELHARLFRDVSYRSGLSLEERGRYVEANRIAALFTARLLAHVMARRLDRLLPIPAQAAHVAAAQARVDGEDGHALQVRGQPSEQAVLFFPGDRAGRTPRLPPTSR